MSDQSGRVHRRPPEERAPGRAGGEPFDRDDHPASRRERRLKPDVAGPAGVGRRRRRAGPPCARRRESLRDLVAKFGVRDETVRAGPEPFGERLAAISFGHPRRVALPDPSSAILAEGTDMGARSWPRPQGACCAAREPTRTRLAMNACSGGGGRHSPGAAPPLLPTRRRTVAKVLKSLARDRNIARRRALVFVIVERRAGSGRWCGGCANAGGQLARRAPAGRTCWVRPISPSRHRGSSRR